LPMKVVNIEPGSEQSGEAKHLWKRFRQRFHFRLFRMPREIPGPVATHIGPSHPVAFPARISKFAIAIHLNLVQILLWAEPDCDRVMGVLESRGVRQRARTAHLPKKP